LAYLSNASQVQTFGNKRVQIPEIRGHEQRHVPGDVTSSEDEAWKGVDEPMVKTGGKGEYLYQNNWYHTNTIGTIPKQLVPAIGRKKKNTLCI
jgi:hypothetical protein